MSGGINIKKKLYIALSVTLLSSAILLSFQVNGANVAQPGTADDPVVTKSYVDQQIQKALSGGTLPSATTAPTPTQAPTAGNTGGSDAVEIVDVEPGETLIASAGAEFIVRAGKAVIYTQDANGVADLTAGVDLKNGEPAPQNHLLSFPRDGRGIAVQEGQTYPLVVMVRGGYTLR